MRTKHFIFLFCLLLSFGLITQCEKYGKPGGDLEVDPDSDRPAWAGGNTDSNTHIKGNDDSGTTRGGDYGDLYVLLRDENGVPEMTQIGEEWYVMPVDQSGVPLELNEEGDLVDPTQAIEVDFGRLNIVRSPEAVLNSAFEEAMKVLTASGANITLDFCGRLTSTYYSGTTLVVKTIDAPRENMSIYKYIMQNLFEPLEGGGSNRLAFLGEDPYNFDPMMIAAACFAAGSDKTGTIDIDEVVYINGFIEAEGLDPILNEHEYDFDHDNKYYFNFGECEDGEPYKYNRPATYDNRYIQFLVWENVYYPVDENGDSDGPVFSVLDVMEGLADGVNRFTYRWADQDETHVKGFAWARDDAVQVLDFVHGDSNIRFLPDYTP